MTILISNVIALAQVFTPSLAITLYLEIFNSFPYPPSSSLTVNAEPYP